uniref:Uncharacterized protein n=1 Tax=Bactrocera latifrons TaxID=174628 RepID=A0A0K8VH46_BACLA
MSDNYDQEVMTPINYSHKKFRAAMYNIDCDNELLTPLYTRPMQNEAMYIKEENNDEDSYESYVLNNSNHFDVYMMQEFPLDLSLRPRLTSTPIHQQNKDVEQAYKLEYIPDFYRVIGSYERPLRPGALLDLNMVHESYIAPLTIDVGDQMDLMEEINAFMNSATSSTEAVRDYRNDNPANKSKNNLDDSEKIAQNTTELEHKETDTEITDDVIEAALILLRMKKGTWKRSQPGGMIEQEPPQKKCKLD